MLLFQDGKLLFLRCCQQESCCWELEEGLAVFQKRAGDGAGQGRAEPGARRWLSGGDSWPGVVGVG